MRKNYLKMETHRTGYAVDQCGRTMTVGELIDYLSQWDDETPIYYSNDNGYTYGSINAWDIDEGEIEDDEDEEDE